MSPAEACRIRDLGWLVYLSHLVGSMVFTSKLVKANLDLK